MKPDTTLEICQAILDKLSSVESMLAKIKSVPK